MFNRRVGKPQSQSGDFGRERIPTLAGNLTVIPPDKQPVTHCVLRIQTAGYSLQDVTSFVASLYSIKIHLKMEAADFSYIKPNHTASNLRRLLSYGTVL